MQNANETTRIPGILERRDVSILLSAVLFASNFLSFYFIWLFVFPAITGLMRVAMCWVGAYALTWMMTYVTKGVSRLVLTLIMLGVQYVIFQYRAQSIRSF